MAKFLGSIGLGGAFNNYLDKMKGRGGPKMSVFVHAQGIKTVHAGRGGTVVDRVYKKRSAEYTITNITLGSALNSSCEEAIAVLP